MALTSGPLDPHAVARAAGLIADADALVVAAGAGMGVDSGLPDFRGTQGFWRAYPALGQAQLDFYTMASPQAFIDHPARAWGFYGHRLNLYRATRPHAGFGLLQRWGMDLRQGLAVFTSNVDGQFQCAGFDPALVHECHGSIHHWQCMLPCCAAIWPAADAALDVDEAQCLLRGAPPACPHCGGMARPNVLMFGDGQWLSQRSDRQAAALARFLSAARRPVVLEIGAGTAVPSVRHFTAHLLQAHGARLVRINPREWQVPSARDVGLPAGAGAALAAIARQIDGA